MPERNKSYSSNRCAKCNNMLLKSCSSYLCWRCRTEYETLDLSTELPDMLESNRYYLTNQCEECGGELLEGKSSYLCSICGLEHDSHYSTSKPKEFTEVSLKKKREEIQLRIDFDQSKFEDNLEIENFVSQTLQFGRTGDKQAIEPLIRIISDFSFRKNIGRIELAMAAKILTQIGDERAVLPLKNLLNEEGFRDITSTSFSETNIIQFLANYVDEEIIKILIELSENSDVTHVRKSALIILMRLDSERIVETVVKSLQDKDPTIQMKSMRWLANNEHKGAAIPICKILDTSNNSDVKLAAIHALRMLESDLASKSLILRLNDNEEEIQESVLRTLLRIRNLDTTDTQIFKKIVENSENKKIRLYAIDILGKFNDESVIDFLLELLEDADIDIQKESLYFLGRIGDIRIIEPIMLLLRKTNDSELKLVGIEALISFGEKNSFGDKNVEDLLKVFLSDEDEEVRDKVINFLEILEETHNNF